MTRPWEKASQGRAGTPVEAAGNELSGKVLTSYGELAPEMLRLAVACCGEKDCARDAVQEAFVALIGALRSGVPVENPKSFLYRALLDEIALRSSREEMTAELAAPAADRPDFDAPLRAAEVRRRLLRISSPRELEMLYLRLDGFSYHEIAQRLEITPGTVARTLARAFLKIRKAFREGAA